MFVPVTQLISGGSCGDDIIRIVSQANGARIAIKCKISDSLVAELKLRFGDNNVVLK